MRFTSLPMSSRPNAAGLTGGAEPGPKGGFVLEVPDLRPAQGRASVRDDIEGWGGAA